MPGLASVVDVASIPDLPDSNHVAAHAKDNAVIARADAIVSRKLAAQRLGAADIGPAFESGNDLRNSNLDRLRSSIACRCAS